MNPLETDLPPLTRFMITVHMLNTVFNRSIRVWVRSGRFGYWHALFSLVLWTWVMLVVLPGLQDWLGV